MLQRKEMFQYETNRSTVQPFNSSTVHLLQQACKLRIIAGQNKGQGIFSLVLKNCFYYVYLITF